MPRCACVVFPIPFDRIFHYCLPDGFEGENLLGRRVLAPFGNKDRIGYIVDIIERSDIRNLKTIKDVLDEQSLISPKMIEFARWIARRYVSSLGQALDIILPQNFRPIRETKKKAEEKSKILPPFIPSPEQQKVLEPIRKSIRESKFKVFLLYGVSDSGKTEVYLQAIAQAQLLGRQSIFLVPEISLTPQFISLFRERFGPARIGLWHSRLSAGERYRTWRLAFEGKIDIIIGPRSAIFAPFPDLGLIVIDEEHDTSYKEEKRPLYHTRELAQKRGELENAVVILGSATPSLESFYKAKNRISPYTLLTLPERIYKRSFPLITVVDLREELKRGNGHRIFSLRLRKAISDRLAKGEQVILFLNRRGYATFVLCRECGFVLKCPNCSVSLVYHYHEKKLKCHYCNHREEIPRFCPRCGGRRIRYFGMGTEKVEEEVKRLFPQARVTRMDMDTVRGKASAERIFNAFRQRKLDILVGTQLVAKGWDFPGVTLVGIISADTILNLPDFRSGEKTFSLITQVAGRSGRGQGIGEVIVQTHNPDHYSIVMAVEHRYRLFYEKELNFRRELNYPPFSNLVLIIVRGKDNEKTRVACEKIHALLSKEIVSAAILGPTPAVLGRIAGKYRWQIIVKTSNLESVADFFQRHNLGFEWRGVDVTVDVDPVSML